MTLARAVQNHAVSVTPNREVIARHRIPAEAAVNVQPRSLSPFVQIFSFSLRYLAGPAPRIVETVIANYREIEIAAIGHAHLLRSPCASPTTAGEHGRYRLVAISLVTISEDQTLGGHNCANEVAIRRRWLTQKLAMR